jgi:MOSC domain-containing protein
MTASPVAPRLANIRLHPIKALDPVQVKEARIGPGGGLELDRAWALYSADGERVNGKRTAAVHLIRAAYAPDLASVTLSAPGDRRGLPRKTFAFPDGSADAAQWFSAYFEQPITVRYAPEGFPDDTVANGPTIISTASLDTVATWFPGLTSSDMRLRFRTTLEIDDVPSFWEDQLFGADPNVMVRFRIGEVQFEGSNPCARCPVPPRNPQTGAEFPGFQKRFTELRRATLPSWSARERFDHYYRMATNTGVASTESGKPLRLNDPVVIL